MAQGLAVALPLTPDLTDGPYRLHKNLTDMAAQNLKMVMILNYIPNIILKNMVDF